MTYNPSLLLPIDRIRFQVDDTDDADPLLPDATYAALLVANGADERLATIAAAEVLIIKIGKQASGVGADGNTASFNSDRLVGLQRLVTRLRAEIASEVAAAARVGFSVAAPTRGGYIGGEYYAGSRVPPEDWA